MCTDFGAASHTQLSSYNYLRIQLYGGMELLVLLSEYHTTASAYNSLIVCLLIYIWNTFSFCLL